MGYRLLRRLARLLLALFYRRVRVAGLEHVPASGAVVVCANHHGSLVDPLALIAVLPRRLRPLAKAPLFRHPLVAPFLRLAGALPVYRPQDRHLVQGSNADLLRACREALARGEAVLIFPEGLSKPEPLLSPLRPGAARMALEAEAEAGFALGVRLVPAGIHLDEAGRFRRGAVFVEVGEPIPARPLAAAHARDPEQAVRGLTQELERALRGVIVEAESAADLRLLRRAVRAWAGERGERLDEAAEAGLARAFARGWRRLLEREPARALRLRADVEAWARTLEHFGLEGDEIDLRYSPGLVATWLLRQAAALALLAPLGLLGAAANWLPYRLTGLAAPRFAEGEDDWATVKITAGLFLFPLTWLAGALAVAALAGPAWGALALLVPPLLGPWALRFRDRQALVRRQARAFAILAGGGGLRRHLREGRRAIHDEIERLRGEPGAAGGGPAAPGPAAAAAGA